MKHHPFHIARFALLASFALMVAVVCLPNPNPSSAWKRAEQTRYEQRNLPANAPAELQQQPETQLANRPAEPQPESPENEDARVPYRTAHLPQRTDHDTWPRGVHIEEPIFFSEEEPPGPEDLAPDPRHLDLPRSAAMPSAPGTR